MGPRLLSCIGALVVVGVSGLSAVAQNSVPACGPPPVVAANSQPNIFSEQQEQWLGDAMADMVERDYRPARDPSQSAYLQKIVDKLAATLPDTHIQFRAVMVDSSGVNGFSLAGGHIYLTRKLAATAQSDDELAAVLGHEMGHIASHQFAFETTRDLKRLLGITSVGDRADVYEKFQKLTDARMKDRHPGKSGDSDDDQGEADKIGVYATAAAGYRPKAFAEFWDRAFFVEGKTGGRMSDFFGITKPDQKRLRGMLKMSADLPPDCGAKLPASGDAFARWHRGVVANQAVEETTTIAGEKTVKLTPPLHMDLERVRFSPDGKTILAQDEGSVFTITREPYAVQFRFDAENALPAQFSPDSQKIVFGTPGLHSEEWSVADKKMVVAHEPLSRHECLESKLSPDGRTVMCVALDEENWEMTLTLLDSDTGAVVWEKKDFFQPSFFIALLMSYSHGLDSTVAWLPSSFSTDGNTLLIGPGDHKLAFDLRTRVPIKIAGDLKSKVTGSYAFIGNDEVAGVNGYEPKSSGIFSFPDGKLVRKMNLPVPALRSVSGPGGKQYVLLSGLTDTAIGLADLESGKILLTSKTPVLDMWDGYVLSENIDGSVLLSRMTADGLGEKQRLTLPLSPLGGLRSVAVSPNGKHLALSALNRGGVWDLATGKQEFLLNGFTSAIWADDDSLYAEFPKIGKADRHVGQFVMTSRAATILTYTIDDKVHMNYGQLTEWKQLKKGGWELTVHNLADASVLWTKTFPDSSPRYTESFGGRELLFTSPLKLNSVKTLLKQNETLAAEAAVVKDKDNGRLIEVVDRMTGKTVAQMVLELPLNFNGTDGLNRAGDLLYMTSSDNRTVVYSLATGKQLRQIFGHVVAVDPESQRVCTVNRRDEAVVYDSNGKDLAHFRSGSTLRHASFREHGTQLILLTADQTVRTVGVASGEGTTAVAAQ